ncbi:MAG: hypothetical protein AB1487_11220 [Thermodesulfobacteriota bacterium]
MKKTILILISFAFLLCFACRSHDFDRKKFENVNCAAQAVRASLKAGANLQQFGDLLKKLSSEIAILNRRVESDREKELLKHYSTLLAIYRDGFTLWKYNMEFTRYGFVPKARIYVGEDVEPIAEKYRLETDSHAFKSTRQVWRSIPEHSIQIIWINADSQMEIINNILRANNS